MNKLKLDLEELAVESFEVAEEKDEEGTVQGNEATPWCNTGNLTCNGAISCNGVYTCADINTCQFDSCDTWCETWCDTFCSR